MKKVAVVGSRQFQRLDLVRFMVQTLQPGDIVVSGGARGVDQAAEEEAKRCGLQTIIFAADWNKYGKGAGKIRNHDIIQSADEVWAFWDGQSRGTAHSLSLAQQQGKRLIVIEGTL